MPPEEQKLEDLRQEFLNHDHDGAVTRQVDPKNLFGFERQVNRIEYVHCEVVEPATDVPTGNDQYVIHIPLDWDNWYLVEVHAKNVTAGVTGTTDIQIRNTTQSDADILSTIITIDTTETGSDTAATAAVIDLTKDQVAVNDSLRVDVDAVQSGTIPKGLYITLGFQEFRE